MQVANPSGQTLQMLQQQLEVERKRNRQRVDQNLSLEKQLEEAKLELSVTPPVLEKSRETSWEMILQARW